MRNPQGWIRGDISDDELRRDKQVLIDLRIQIVDMLHKAGSGHPGSSLSAVDIIYCLYKYILKGDPNQAADPDRDRFVLSKGHGCPALYAVLAHFGYFEPELLDTLRKLESPLQGHPDRARFPLMEASTGSLGQGLSIAQGMALAAKLDKKDYRVYCVIGDGESQEGQVWEAAMSAPKFGLDNLVVILDYNHGQIDGHVDEVMEIEPIVDKWRAFRWNVLEMDGHTPRSIVQTLAKAANHQGGPTFILAHTIKGKGVSFMEHQIKWHGVAPNEEQTRLAISELEDQRAGQRQLDPADVD